MGLLDKLAKKEKESKKRPAQKIKKEPLKPLIDEQIKEEKPLVHEQIKKEEQPEIKEKEHNLSLKSAKLQIQRPISTSEPVNKPEKIDMSELKEKIEAKIEENKQVQAATHGFDFKEIKKSIRGKIHGIVSDSADRVPTGIPGLDNVMEGGFRKNTVNLIGGGAGCGKSIFCMQFLKNGIDMYNEPCVYVSFEESTTKILNDFKIFNWNLDGKIQQKKLVLMHYTPEQVEKVLESGGGIIRDVIESINAKRVIIDSLTAFALLHKDELARRKAVLQLFEMLNNWKCTVLVTSEQEPDPEKHESTILEFEVDGVILLYNIRKGDIRERSLEIFKMRATRHAAKIFPMTIDDNGMTIFPEETVF